jgi:hypothetical protein
MHQGHPSCNVYSSSLRTVAVHLHDYVCNWCFRPAQQKSTSALIAHNDEGGVLHMGNKGGTSVDGDGNDEHSIGHMSNSISVTPGNMWAKFCELGSNLYNDFYAANTALQYKSRIEELLASFSFLNTQLIVASNFCFD